MSLRWSDFDHYLKAAHLQGKRVTLTIAEVALEEIHSPSGGGKAEQKPVMYFEGSKKGLILSPTNQHKLQELFGDDVSACIGKRVTLEATALRVAGRQTFPIRILAAPAAAAPAAAPAQPAPAAPAPAPAPAPVVPVSPTEALRARLAGKAASHTEPAANDTLKRVRGALRLLSGDTEVLQTVLQFLTGTDNTAQLTAGWCEALIAWVAPRKVDETTWVASEAALADARAIVTAAVVSELAAGQPQ